MRWYAIFIKGIKEQVREYWILLMTVLMAPLFIALYFLMVEAEEPVYDVILVNLDRGAEMGEGFMNVGDSIIAFSGSLSAVKEVDVLHIDVIGSREEAIMELRIKNADAVVVLPSDLSSSMAGFPDSSGSPSCIELVGDVTQMEYIICAIWAEELINRYIQDVSGIRMPVTWSETTLGFSGGRTTFEIYLPGLLVLSIIMIIFSASAAMVRESEYRTLERLRISRLTALEFLGGISLVQILIAILSLLLALSTAFLLGYTLIPGTLGFIVLISMLTALSMISFSLLVAAMCRSIKDVAIIGTFPLFLLMFFTGAAFPINGGGLFSIGGYQVMLNDLLSPKFAVEALNKVLIRGMEVKETVPEIIALVVLSILYFIAGAWAFKRRHMRAR